MKFRWLCFNFITWGKVAQMRTDSVSIQHKHVSEHAERQNDRCENESEGTRLIP